MSKTGKTGWIGVDLDGTLAHYEGWKGPEHIGDPVPMMALRVRSWLADGECVKIFTARVSTTSQNIADAFDAKRYIQGWLQKHFGQPLDVVCEKDFAMIELWDDRAVQVIPNTGERADGK